MSMIQVAKSAGVSQSTVSRVVRADPRISAETAKRVWAAIERLNYKPHTRRRERSSRRLKTGNVGLLLAGRSRELLKFPSIARFVGGVSERATASGLNLLIVEMPDVRTLPAPLQERSVDGVIVVGRAPDPEMARRILPLPCVWCGGEPFTIPLVDQVTTNHGAIGGLAADYLLRCGCQRPVFLNHDPHHTSFPFVRDAFRRSMAQAGVDVVCFESPVSSDPIKEADMWLTDRVRKMFVPLIDRLLAEVADCDSLFVPTDQQAATVHHLLAQRGPPLDAARKLISCNNDEPWLATIHPRSATIETRQAEQGRRAVSRLVKRIKHPHEGIITVLVAPRLVAPTDVDQPLSEGTATQIVAH